MLFSSLEFLFLFLAAVIVLYYALPGKWRNPVLLAVSLVFYGWGEPRYIFLMIFTIAVDYTAGLLVSAFLSRGKKKKAKAALVIAVSVNLALLGFFKYADFALYNMSRLPGLSFISPLGIALPIGISFYTFQCLSYVIDVYRGDAGVQKNPVTFGTYVTLFPQLIAGPIVRYRDIDAELRARTCSVPLFAEGVRTFTAGLSKKVLLSNPAAEMWKYYSTMPSDERSALGAWLGLVFFCFHIYFDFSGYSDMAIGFGKMFGFHFPENFNYPYVSKSITEFWRRWHISLSLWFREYVYIPLGGNRCAAPRRIFNLFVVWFLTGLWHGANWNFIIWGLYFFVLLVLEKYVYGKLLEKAPKALRHAYALFFIAVGFLIFACDDLSAGAEYLSSMLGKSGAFAFGIDGYELLRNFPLVFVMCIGATPLPRRFFAAQYEKSSFFRGASVIICLAALILCTAFLVDSSYNPFLYFRF